MYETSVRTNNVMRTSTNFVWLTKLVSESSLTKFLNNKNISTIFSLTHQSWALFAVWGLTSVFISASIGTTKRSISLLFSACVPSKLFQSSVAPTPSRCHMLCTAPSTKKARSTTGKTSVTVISHVVSRQTSSIVSKLTAGTWNI